MRRGSQRKRFFVSDDRPAKRRPGKPRGAPSHRLYPTRFRLTRTGGFAGILLYRQRLHTYLLASAAHGLSFNKNINERGPGATIFLQLFGGEENMAFPMLGPSADDLHHLKPADARALRRMSACLARFVVDRVAPVLGEVAARLEAAAPRIAQAIARIERLPRVKGYEEYLEQQGHPALVARLLANLIIKLGRQLRQERLAAKKVASVVCSLVKAQGATALVLSRKAKALQLLLSQPCVDAAFKDAWLQAAVAEPRDTFLELVDRARARDKTACQRLVEIAKSLKPYLCDPHGRAPTVVSATHELLLHLAGRGYTFSYIFDDMTDPATLATREALDAPYFDPRPARRRLKARRA